MNTPTYAILFVSRFIISSKEGYYQEFPKINNGETV